MHYLYKIIDMLNNKVYIGQTIDVHGRWRAHKSYAKNPEKTGQYIHRAMAKYGVENFMIEIIATCRTQENADETENLLIKQYNSRNDKYGYNLLIGGSYGGHSEETKKKMSESHMGEKNPNYGKSASEETRLKMSNRRKGVKHSEEWKNNISFAKKNKSNGREGRRKLSPEATQAILNDTRPPRTIAKEYGVGKKLILTIKKRGN